MTEMVPWAALDVLGWWDALSPRQRLLLSSLGLILALLLGALVIYLVDRWRRRPEGPAVAGPNDQMSSFRQLYERGQLSQEEFDRIREKLTGRLRQATERKALSDDSGKPASDAFQPRPDDKPPT